ncbi:MAG: UbiD family decarboxylase [Lewinellaceae bacterium]|nr:UbiD family decarboxylase [Saprospiraceae bacterium]MCB9311167.1 UbiD family decarboxylase [Lewinellaceae bacterium]
MAYRSLAQAASDLERTGQLVRIDHPVDADLEMAEIHRRVQEADGPALLFTRVKGSPFPALSNLYGTYERARYLFRDTLPLVEQVVRLKGDPMAILRHPWRFRQAPFAALHGLPRHRRHAPVLYGTTRIDQLPLVKSWPDDGGAFVTLPQVVTLPPGSRRIMSSNVGMYRIQLSGNDYDLNREVGMHYQLHRGIGVHHTAYNRSDEPFRATICIGGPPANAFSAIMPLPEGLSELTFAGMLNGHRFPYHFRNGHFIANEADFCITGTIRKDLLKPEGPFGDHLGYYSLRHDFPVMEVENVYHRKDAIWHFTVVGRPPQEDSIFGRLIHDLVGDLLPSEFPGIRDVHAVDDSGVHPLLLAVGSERYMPFREPVPEEILTQANHLLGKGQTTLAKFLIIADGSDHPQLDAHDIPAFFSHVLERIRWERDLHFQTQTTMDTLDYSGSGWNAGSKVVMACRGQVVRTLGTEVPSITLPDGWQQLALVRPGILALSGVPFTGYDEARIQLEKLSSALASFQLESYPLIVLQDDAGFAAMNMSNFLWTTFTRTNPSHDIHGVRSFYQFKHWGCTGPLILDARTKPHHAPPLIPDPEVKKKVDTLFQRGGPLSGVLSS